MESVNNQPNKNVNCSYETIFRWTWTENRKHNRQNQNIRKYNKWGYISNRTKKK